MVAFRAPPTCDNFMWCSVNWLEHFCSLGYLQINAEDSCKTTPLEWLVLHINRGLIHHKPSLNELKHMEEMSEKQTDIDKAAVNFDADYQKQVGCEWFLWPLFWQIENEIWGSGYWPFRSPKRNRFSWRAFEYSSMRLLRLRDILNTTFLKLSNPRSQSHRFCFKTNNKIRFKNQTPDCLELASSGPFLPGFPVSFVPAAKRRQLWYCASRTAFHPAR